MSTSPTWATPARSTVGTLVLGLVFAMAIGGIAVGPARGQEPERRPWREQQREHGREQREHGRERWEERGGRAYPPYGY